MRSDTRRRLDRALWIERAKYAGFGLAIAAGIASAFKLEALDLSLTDRRVTGIVEALEPVVTKSLAAGFSGVTVAVALDAGAHVRVIADKAHAPRVGDRIEITEHRHGTGRVTHTLK